VINTHIALIISHKYKSPAPSPEIGGSINCPTIPLLRSTDTIPALLSENDENIYSIPKHPN